MTKTHLSVVAALAAIAMIPAAAYAAPGSDHPGAADVQPQPPGTPDGTDPPGTSAGDTSGSQGSGNAYGRDCAEESHHHVAGSTGTPFSQCVVALAHLHSGSADSPRAACAALSHKHVKGQHGTPFSDCVAAGAKLRGHHHGTGGHHHGGTPIPTSGTQQAT